MEEFIQKNPFSVNWWHQ